MTHSTQPQSREVCVSLRVKPYDIDVVGVVSNIVYVRWMEDLRLAMLDAFLPLDEQMADGIAPAILKVEIEYKRAIQMHDEVIATMWLSGLEKLRFEVTAEFRANGHVAATGRQEGWSSGVPEPAACRTSLRFGCSTETRFRYASCAACSASMIARASANR